MFTRGKVQIAVSADLNQGILAERIPTAIPSLCLHTSAGDPNC